MNKYDFKIQNFKVYQEFKESINNDKLLTNQKKKEIINRFRKRLFNI